MESKFVSKWALFFIGFVVFDCSVRVETQIDKAPVLASPPPPILFPPPPPPIQSPPPPIQSPPPPRSPPIPSPPLPRSPPPRWPPPPPLMRRRFPLPPPEPPRFNHQNNGRPPHNLSRKRPFRPPPPKKRGLNAGKTVGMLFVGIAAVMQICFAGFLVYKRRQLF